MRNLTNVHLTDGELVSYRNKALDQMRTARVEAHLKQCFICEQQLAQVREESADLKNRRISPSEIDFVDRLMEQRGLEHQPSARKSGNSISKPVWSERLIEYLHQLTEGWRAFSLELKPVRDAAKEIPLWEWQSDDGVLRARVWLKPNAALLVRVSCSDLSLDGARVRISAGSFEQEKKLQCVPESEEVSADLEIPRNNHPGRLADISISV